MELLNGPVLSRNNAYTNVILILFFTSIITNIPTSARRLLISNSGTSTSKLSTGSHVDKMFEQSHTNNNYRLSGWKIHSHMHLNNNFTTGSDKNHIFLPTFFSFFFLFSL